MEECEVLARQGNGCPESVGRMQFFVYVFIPPFSEVSESTSLPEAKYRHR